MRVVVRQGFYCILFSQSTYPYSPYVAYCYGELNCDELHILIISFRPIWTYQYPTAYIHTLSLCWHGPPLVYQICAYKNGKIKIDKSKSNEKSYMVCFGTWLRVSWAGRGRSVRRILGAKMIARDLADIRLYDS